MKVAKDISPGHALAPWLVFPTGRRRNQLTFFNISDDPNNSNCVRKVCHEIHEKRCLAAMHGWFIVKQVTSKQFQCSLWNPTTREIINLPSGNQKDFQNIERNCILLSPPTEPINPDCMVLFWGKSFFMFWKQGDIKWTRQSYKILNNGIETDQSISMVSVCPTNGVIYALTDFTHLAVIDRKPCGVLSVSLLGFGSLPMYPEVLQVWQYLVESCGEIYCVAVHFVGLSEEKINHLEVFKMDLLKKIWVKVECLGDRIFCLSDTNCVSFSASKAGMKGNKVYLTLWQDDNLYVFNLQDECSSIHLPCPNLATAGSSPFWLMPTNRNRLIEIHKEDESRTTKDKLVKMEILDNAKAIENDSVESKVLSSVGLPRDVLLSITARLSLPVDHMNFRLVCKTFALLVPHSGQWTRTQYPSLMFSNREKSKCSFLDPMYNVDCCFDMPELLGARICFSKDGWLLMKKGDRSMFFFNPFTKTTIRLPDLPELHFGLNGLSFTAPPTSSSCIVFGFFNFLSYVRICFLHLGDKGWNNSEHPNNVEIALSNNNPVFYNGAFYCLGLEGHLGVFNLSKCGWNVFQTPHQGNLDEGNGEMLAHQSYLVECNGEMLAVFIGHMGKWVHVYKLDWTFMNWRLLKSLEDHVLFVSRTTSLSMKAVNKQMRNKIYFPFSFNHKNNGVFYCLETSKWQSSFGDFLKEDIYDTMEILHCTWIQPWVQQHSLHA
ncbi:hypothetical protein AQUCO_02700254v1 [Aquilegia coerulea]|uniref:KIB1-4 beta-propeller domain-containing protein n=1 Tax=Aquilegia coerulea TaxID=218851 RepID=A0A2G5D602_AQUCA|nr:hypothetical protein AQUCO_02700254v1 [Aquilegia coerulea]